MSYLILSAVCEGRKRRNPGKAAARLTSRAVRRRRVRAFLDACAACHG